MSVTSTDGGPPIRFLEKPKDGGPMFATPETLRGPGQPGASVRVWLAGQALATFMLERNDGDGNGREAEDIATIARVAVAIADATLAELEKGEGT